MRSDLLSKPAVPVAYGHLILEIAAERGVGREALLAGLNLPPGLLEKPDARLSLPQAGTMLFRALKLTKDPALGYEIGLRSNLTTHGFIGYGVMSAPSLRTAVEFGIKFLQLRLPNLGMRLYTQGPVGVIEVVESVQLGELRRCMFDLFLVGLSRMAPSLTGGRVSAKREIELWFDYPQPEYYEAYRERLPPMRFSMGANQMRFPAEFLDPPLQTANAVTARLVTQQLENELSLLGYAPDLLGRVRAALVLGRRGYPGLTAVAAGLHVSSRTLKRKLQQQGASFQKLLDEARRRDSIHLLGDTTLSLADIAGRVGYADPASFTRAFRKWTDSTPSAFRVRISATVP